MTLSAIAARLTQVTQDLEFVARQHDFDMPDEIVAKYVMNIFVDSKFIFALLGRNRPETE